MEELVSTADAARMLGVSASTLTRMALRRDLAVAVQAPGPTGARLFRRAEVAALAQTRATA